MAEHPSLDALIATMARLRGEGGCPWDAEQTHHSLVSYLLEEVFELVEALESGSRDDIREELGDVLYQILFHADIAASDLDDPFTIDDVAGLVDQKMRDRHPHVFADGDARTVQEVTKRWDEIKAEQKSHRDSVLEGIPAKLSALARAQSVIKRATQIDVSPSTSAAPGVESEGELGEALFALVAYAKERGWDAERALRTRTRDFETRVSEAEARALSPEGEQGS
jgi:XTP/dITP diphosphohydrolase